VFSRKAYIELLRISNDKALSIVVNLDIDLLDDKDDKDDNKDRENSND